MPFTPPPEQTAQWEREDWERERRLYVAAQESLGETIKVFRAIAHHSPDDRTRVTAGRTLLAILKKLDQQKAAKPTVTL